MNTTLKLVRTELRLVLREPLVLAFVFAFPIVTVLVIAGSFGADDAHSFANVDPSQWYVAVVPGGGHRRHRPGHGARAPGRIPGAGVLRRFAAAGFPRWSFAAAQLAVGVILTLVASAVLLVVAGLVYGLPPVTSPLATVTGVVLGAVAFTSVGLFLGAVVPNARAAQGVGLLVFCVESAQDSLGPSPAAVTRPIR